MIEAGLVVGVAGLFVSLAALVYGRRGYQRSHQPILDVKVVGITLRGEMLRGEMKSTASVRALSFVVFSEGRDLYHLQGSIEIRRNGKWEPAAVVYPSSPLHYPFGNGRSAAFSLEEWAYRNFGLNNPRQLADFDYADIRLALRSNGKLVKAVSGDKFLMALRNFKQPVEDIEVRVTVTRAG